METLTLLRELATRGQNVTSQILENVTREQLVWLPEGGQTNQIAATILHVFHGEDRAVHRALGAPTIFESQGWQARLGYRPESPWERLPAADPDAVRAYVAAVWEETRRYLEGLSPGDLDREIETPRGKRTVGDNLAHLLVAHKFTHLGEVAALLGCQGMRGFPF